MDASLCPGPERGRRPGGPDHRPLRRRDRLQGWQSAVVSGWQLNSIVTLQTGQPFTVALPSGLDNSNTGQAFLGFGAGDRPNVIGNPVLANQAATFSAGRRRAPFTSRS